MGWKFDRTLTSKKFYAGQLLNEPMLSWFDKHFVTISFAGFAIPFSFGFAIGGLELGTRWFAYFGAFRVFVGYFSLNLWSMGYATAWIVQVPD